MRNSEEQTNPNGEEESIAKILRLVGRRTDMPDSTRETWSRVFGAELEQVIARRRQRRRIVVGAFGMCASLLIFYLFFGQALQQQWIEDTAIAYVSKTVGETVGTDASGRNVDLKPGGELLASTALRTSANGLLALELGETSIRLNENTGVRLFQRRVQLLKGQLYVDSNTTLLSEEDAITITTPFATVRDIGTQFTVSYDAGGVTTAVREGAIIVAVEEGEYRANAHRDYAQKISVSRDSEVEVTKTGKRGDEWDWSMRLAESFTIEGRSAYDFLNWAARETGLNLVFDNDQVRQNAQTTILHGDISSFTPDQAIDIVLATTRLSAKRPDKNTLYIWLIGE